MIVAGDLVC